jgi:hypothetical protein
LLAGAGDDEALAVARKQLEAESRFERFHLLAYSYLADAEFFCCPCEVLAPSRYLKGFECIQRRQTAWHRQDLGCVTRGYCRVRLANNSTMVPSA